MLPSISLGMVKRQDFIEDQNCPHWPIHKDEKYQEHQIWVETFKTRLNVGEIQTYLYSYYTGEF